MDGFGKGERERRWRGHLAVWQVSDPARNDRSVNRFTKRRASWNLFWGGMEPDHLPPPIPPPLPKTTVFGRMRTSSDTD